MVSKMYRQTHRVCLVLVYITRPSAEKRRNIKENPNGYLQWGLKSTSLHVYVSPFMLHISAVGPSLICTEFVALLLPSVAFPCADSPPPADGVNPISFSIRLVVFFLYIYTGSYMNIVERYGLLVCLSVFLFISNSIRVLELVSTVSVSAAAAVQTRFN
jgi:hypothetical protein